MENYAFVSRFETYQIPIQILKLKDSFFVYVGTPDMNFENLIISTFDKEDQLKSNSCTVLDDEYSEIGKSFAEKLSTRFKCPFYFSFNLPDGLLSLNREFYFTIEKDIFEKIKILV